jgi:hypothetical protein
VDGVFFLVAWFVVLDPEDRGHLGTSSYSLGEGEEKGIVLLFVVVIKTLVVKGFCLMI